MPEKKKANNSYTGPRQVQTSASPGRWSPFAAPTGPFQSVALPAQQPTPTRAPSSVSAGSASGLAANTTLAGAGVPQSFVDGLADLVQRDQAAGNEVTSFNGITTKIVGGAGQWNSQGTEKYTVPIKTGDAPRQLTQEEFDAFVLQSWQAAPPDQKQKYITQDQTTIAGIQKRGLQSQAMAATLGAPEVNRQANNNYWGTQVTPLEKEDQAAYDRMVSGNRALEKESTGYVTDYASTLKNNEAQRMAGIGATNRMNSGLSDNYMAETLATNQRNLGFGQQITDNANKYNAQQDQLFGTYRDQANAINANQNALTSQNASTLNGISANQSALAASNASELRGISANQTGLYNQFMGDISNANSQQNANLGQFGRSVSSRNATATGNLNNLGARTGEYNQRQSQFLDDFSYEANRASDQQTGLLNTYTKQLASMNAEDRAAYMKYLQETNPLMAERIAQGSNPEYVQNQEDVVSRYRELSKPEVTGQERLLAELARRKFETDDKSSRDAQMQQLAARGLRSGGLTIANQQATRQQLAQDRQLNELGLNASAVQRGLIGMEGYNNASNALRNADDSMRNFQDVYRQNEAVRTGNLAQQRNQQSLNTTGQITQRDTLGYNAGTQTIRDNYGRQQDIYDASTQTNNLNYDRDYNYYTASQQTNNDNYGRDRDLYNAQSSTVNDNFSRTQAGADYGRLTNLDNTARSNDIFNNGTTTNDSNTTRANDIFSNGSTTNRDNDTRNANTFWAGTSTTNANAGRTDTAIKDNMDINNGNLGRFGDATTLGIKTNTDNDNRFQGGLNSGNLAAGSILGAQAGDLGLRSGNLINESNTATNRANSGASRASTFSGIQATTTSQQQEALYRALGLSDKEIAEIMGGVA